MELSQGLALLGIGGLVLLTVSLCLWIIQRRGARADADREVRQQFSGARILASNSNALFRGLDRGWDSQWRGRGVLVLTDQVLYYRSWQRKLDITVPIDRIQDVSVSVRREKNGRGRRHLLVRYRGMDNQVRVAAWRVREASRWVEQVHALCNRP